MTGPRRLSHAISEGDGISLIVAVRGPEDAVAAEARGAEALLAEGDGIDSIRAATGLPIVTADGALGDARIVCPGDDDLELGDAVELVVQVEREEELEEALERFDPELFVLSAPDLDRVPPVLIAAYITEFGLLPPSQIAAHAARLAEALPHD